jgi:hypothetical protein
MINGKILGEAATAHPADGGTAGGTTGGTAGFFLFRTSKIAARNHQSRGDQFGLGRMPRQKIIFTVDPDMLDQETLETVYDKIDRKEISGLFDVLADRPKDAKKYQAHQRLIDWSRKNRDRHRHTIMRIDTVRKPRAARIDNVVRIRIGKEPVW